MSTACNGSGGRPERCKGCPFKGVTVTHRGPIDAEFVIVGESPGSEEVKSNKPFVGASGKLLNKLLPKDIKPLYINSFSCFPGNPNSKASSKDKRERITKTHIAVQQCKGRVHDIIKSHPRKIILTLGNAAAWSITGDHDTKITKIRGSVYDTPLAKYGVVTTVHPAYLLRGGGSLRQFRRDILYAVSLSKGGERQEFVDPKTYIVDTPKKVRKLISRMYKYEYIAADIETGGFDYMHDEVLALGIGWKVGQAHIITEAMMPLFCKYGALTIPHHKWIWQNGKFDIKFFRHQYKVKAVVHEDTMLLSYANDETGGVHSLEQLGVDWLGAPNYKDMLDAYLPNKKTSYRVIPKDVLYKYAGKDVGITFQVFHILRKIVASDPHLEKLYTQTLLPASEYLTTVEENGFWVNQKRVKQNTIELPKEMDVFKEKLNVYAREKLGKDINPNSHIQVKDLLYEGLQLKINGRKPLSSDAKTLDKLPNHPAVKALKDYRKVAKAFGTYVKNMPDHLADDGRVHATYKLHGSVTGRLASSDPNLQNIPRWPQLRSQYAVPEGKVLIEVDLNQAELRSLACLSNDTALCSIYNSNHLSLHDEVAIELFGKDFTKEDKMRAKAVNFGIVYGRTAISLALEYDISMKEAQSWIDGWFNRFPQAHDFIMKCRAAPMRQQTIVTCFGRKKRFGVLSGINMRDTLNEASNFPHQAIASDITLHAGMIISGAAPRKYCLNFTDQTLQQLDSKIVNTVHDSFLIEAPDNQPLIDKVCDLATSVMEKVPVYWGLTKVPFKSDAEIGTEWGYLKNPLD